MSNESKSNGSTELTRLLQMITNVEDDVFEKHKEDYADNFMIYYRNEGYNLYTPAYRWVRDIKGEDGDYLIARLEQIEAILKEKKFEKEHFVNFLKFKDYVFLEISRNTDNADVKKSVIEVKTTVKEVKDLKSKIENDRNDSLAQTVTILSIFTGIAMAFFGGFSMLGSAFQTLNGTKVVLYQVAIISIIVGIVLFNTIFAFIYIAAKISGKPISSTGHSNCLQCTNKEKCAGEWGIFNPLKKGYKKYPYAFAVNVLLIVMLVGSILLHSCAIKDTESKKHTEENNANSEIIQSSEIVVSSSEDIDISDDLLVSSSDG